MTIVIKSIKNIDDLTPKEAKELRRALGKMAKEVKAPDNTYLEGKKAISQKPRYKEVKGPNKEYLNRKW